MKQPPYNLFSLSPLHVLPPPLLPVLPFCINFVSLSHEKNKMLCNHHLHSI